jgi:hypothetical protein
MRTQRVTLAFAILLAALAMAYLIAHPPTDRACTDDCPETGSSTTEFE